MIGKVLKEERIRIPLRGKTKEEVIEELVSLIFGDDRKEEIIRKCHEREGRMSTGVGKGVALPRYRGKEMKGILASFGTKPEGIDFHALDGKPVHTIFFLASGEEEETGYVDALARIARILNQEDFQERLVKGKNSREVFDLLKKEEEKLWR